MGHDHRMGSHDIKPAELSALILVLFKGTRRH